MRLSTPLTMGLAASAPALAPRASAVTLATTIPASSTGTPLTVWETVIMPSGGVPGVWHPPPSSLLKTAIPSSTLDPSAVALLTSTKPYSHPHWPPRLTYTCRQLYGQTPGVSPAVPELPKTDRWCNTDAVTLVTVVNEAPKEGATSPSSVRITTSASRRPWHFSPPEDVPENTTSSATSTFVLDTIAPTRPLDPVSTTANSTGKSLPNLGPILPISIPWISHPERRDATTTLSTGFLRSTPAWTSSSKGRPAAFATNTTSNVKLLAKDESGYSPTPTTPSEARPAEAPPPESHVTPPPESHTSAEPEYETTTRPWANQPPPMAPPLPPTQPAWFTGNQTGMVPPDYGGVDLGDGHEWWSWDEMQSETWHHGARNPQALYQCVGHYIDFVVSWQKDPKSRPENGGWASLDLEQGWPCRAANVAFRILPGNKNKLPHYAYSVPFACRMGRKMIEAISNGAATYSCRVKTAGAMAVAKDYADFMWWPLGGGPPPHPHRGTKKENVPDVKWSSQFFGQPPV